MGGAADDLPNITPTVFHRHEPFCSDSLRLRADTSTEAVREYAEEVMQWSSQSSTEEEKKVLIELAFTWTQAASLSERKSVGPLRA